MAKAALCQLPPAVPIPPALLGEPPPAAATYAPTSGGTSGSTITGSSLQKSSGGSGSTTVPAAASSANFHQMAIDTAIGPITGGVSLMAPMAARSFGRAAQKARRSGGDLARQLAYGTGSAALSVFTENLFDPIEGKPGIFGKGILNKQMNALFGEFENTTPGVISKSALEEGLEEVAESAGQDIVLKSLTLGKSPLSTQMMPSIRGHQRSSWRSQWRRGSCAALSVTAPLQNFSAVQDPESTPAQQAEQNVEPIVQAIQTVAQQQDAARQAAVRAAANAARQTSCTAGYRGCTRRLETCAGRRKNTGTSLGNASK